MKKTLLLACASFIIAACSSDKKTNDNNVVATVKVATVQSAADAGQWQFPCRVKAGSEINVAFKVAGTLRRTVVSEGQCVAKGQLLAEMDDTDYRVQLSATEAEYAQIKAEAERVIKLYEQGATTASNYDKARYGLQQIEAKLANHRNQLAYCRIYAPEAGTVQSILFEGGETLAAGMPVVRLVGSGRPEVEITVPIAVQQRLSEIREAVATFNGVEGKQFQLHLLHALPKANATGMFPVRLGIEGDELHNLTPGISGWVTITINNDTTGSDTFVPSTAILHSENGDCIYIIKEGKACRVDVIVEALLGDGSARISGNVQAGQQVVASGVHNIKDGQKVEPLGKASPTNVGGLL